MSQKKKIVFILAFILSVFGYIYLAYFHSRPEFVPFILVLIPLFFIYYILSFSKWKVTDWKTIFISAFFIRLLFLFSTPELSDDYHRFFWDGNLIENGINPYLENPEYFSSHSSIGNSPEMELYLQKMNSSDYYSVYPPLLQLSFTTATTFSKFFGCSPILVYRILFLVTEAFLFFILMQLLVYLKKPKERIAIYAFNPLIILEFTGNFHGEIFVITFLLASLVLLIKEKFWLAGILIGCAISFKLTPLIFMPLLLNYLGWKKGMLVSSFAGFTFLFTFLPFIDSYFIAHISESIALYFNNFEFNASVYNVLQFIGKQINGKNNAEIIGQTMGALALLTILFFSFKRVSTDIESLIKRLTIILFIYLLLAPVVHAWYITPLIAFTVLSTNRISTLWSFLIFLSYSAYATFPYKENSWMIFTEYLFLLLAILFIYFSTQIKAARNMS